MQELVKQKPGFLPGARVSARACWLIPLCVLVYPIVYGTMFSKQQDEAEPFLPVLSIIVGVVMLLGLVAGAVLAVRALVGVRRECWVGLVVQGVIGLILNGVVLFAVIYAAMLPYTGGLDGRWNEVVDTSGEGYDAHYKLEMRGKARREVDMIKTPNGITIYFFIDQATSYRGNVLMRVFRVSAFANNGFITDFQPLYEDTITQTLSQYGGTETSRQQVNQGYKKLIVEGDTRKPQGRIRIEIYHRDSSVYAVIYMAKDGHWKQEDADRFFGSFQLL